MNKSARLVSNFGAGIGSIHKRKILRRGIVFVLVLGALIQFGQGLYILAKAEVAQVLIGRAWNHNQRVGRIENKPWAWADTTPVARLGFMRQRKSLVVLSGDSGHTLAFGPGHNPNTPMPGTGGNSVISGHRDTHFAVLRTVVPGDLITSQSVDGTTVHYEVQSLRIVNKSQVEVTGDNGLDELTLVTCWPFDALTANGPERLVVSAHRTTFSAVRSLTKSTQPL